MSPMKPSAARVRRIIKRNARYSARQQWLAEYALYLTSDHWKQLRQRMLVRAHYTCDFCGNSRQLQVHHLTYERIGRERVTDLVVLCRTCHERVHQLHKSNPALSLRDATNLAKRQTKLIEFDVRV